MGAAETSDHTYGGSAAEEFISGDTKDSALAPTWSSLQSQFDVGLSTTSIALSTGAPQTVPVTVWASGRPMAVSASITSGAGSWSVAPATCALPAGAECTIDVDWNPLDGSSSTGILTVTGPKGARTITLSAPLQPGQRADLAAAVGRHTLHGASSTVLTGTLTDAATGAPLAGREVTVETRTADRTTWVHGATTATTSSGVGPAAGPAPCQHLVQTRCCGRRRLSGCDQQGDRCRRTADSHDCCEAHTRLARINRRVQADVHSPPAPARGSGFSNAYTGTGGPCIAAG